MNVDIKLPKIGKDLLDKLQSKAITMGEFEKETAYWMIESLNECKWKPYPTLPTELLDFYKRKKYDKKVQMDDAFWQQDHIRQYVASNGRIKAENGANKYWLKWMQTIIPKEDTVNHKKISDILCTFPKLDV